MTHTLIRGDAATQLRNLPAKSVQLVVTSPPYYNLKDYDHPDQIGYGQSYEEYLSSLNDVWVEAERVLEPGCRIAINIGDQFLRAKDNNGVYKILPIHSDIIQQFSAIPGMIHLGPIIWRKITTTKTSGGGSWMGSTYYPRDGYVTYEHEYILIFKKTGKARRPSKEAKEKSRLTKEQRSKWFRGIWDDLRPARQKDHPAQFPVELPERLIRMFTFHGEQVLDPFCGSGNTLRACQKTGRAGIGVELNPEYAELALSKLDGDPQ